MTHIAIAALLMGLAGSLHCAGMCGPLVAVIPYNRSSWSRFALSKFFNHLGRIITYTLMGLAAGGVGQSVKAAGWQQTLAIAAGVMVLLMILPVRWRLPYVNGFAGRVINWFKKRWAVILNQRKPHSLFLLGLLHGLLPCGLVYVALAAALATGSSAHGAFFMALFGLGTTPALVLIAALSKTLIKRFGLNTMRWVRTAAVLSALLLIVRGSNLGIPYLSPKVNTEKCEMDCCHPHK